MENKNGTRKGEEGRRLWRVAVDLGEREKERKRRCVIIEIEPTQKKGRDIRATTGLIDVGRVHVSGLGRSIQADGVADAQAGGWDTEQVEERRREARGETSSARRGCIR